MADADKRTPQNGHVVHSGCAVLALIGGCIARCGDDFARLFARSADDIGGISARYADDFGRAPLHASDDLMPLRSADPATAFHDVDDLAAQRSTKHAEETGRLAPQPVIRDVPQPLPDPATTHPTWHGRMTYEGAKLLSRSTSNEED